MVVAKSTILEDPLVNGKTQESFSIDEIQVTLSMCKGLVKTQINIPTKNQKQILHFAGGNKFLLYDEDMKAKVLIQPQLCKAILRDVLDLRKELNYRKTFRVVLIDPHWATAGNKNPTRGLTLTYPTVSAKQLESLPLTLFQKEGDFIFIWVNNSQL